MNDIPPKPYSVTMRALSQGHHISGAERIISFPDVPRALAALEQRARQHPLGPPDTIHLSIQSLEAADIGVVPALNRRDYSVDHKHEARRLVADILVEIGISPTVANDMLSQLVTVTGVPGARVIDDQGRDLATVVRASHLDLAGADPAQSVKNHHAEAMAVASKVASGPGVLAELCISDDPDYTTGYVACQGVYHRIPMLKDPGELIGTRIVVVAAGTDVARLKTYLKEQPVIVA
ncbi:hypothetical protein GSS88_01465 [Corynebacterium sp. 3HC-13]|uniref:6-carboxyhexanoate--CoA ligase n=1 Tax=Corynebacterium poyangense TaxID=2684405 RepID=UPI001CCF59FC|nr:6-carboxyhexanoate--CoA ligase [Corynebacterium poyangense]MBZ8176469.1 hypothetical protein [Corynebacterium poyangense]